MMTMVNVTNFRKDVFEYLSKVIAYNEVIHVTTKEGNAVVLSEDAYNGLMETLYLYANPKVRDEIIEGIHTPLYDSNRLISAEEMNRRLGITEEELADYNEVEIE